LKTQLSIEFDIKDFGPTKKILGMKTSYIMHKEGFQKCNADHCYFFKRYESSYIILLLYVNDMLVAGSDMDKIKNLKMQLSIEFDIKYFGPTKKILGMKMTRDNQC